MIWMPDRKGKRGDVLTRRSKSEIRSMAVCFGRITDHGFQAKNSRVRYLKQ